MQGPILLHVDCPITQTGLGLPCPSPHSAVPTEGIVLGNPESQDQALRLAVLTLGLLQNPLEDLSKHSWEGEEFLIQQACGKEGDKNLQF